MYIPKANEETRVPVLHELMRRHPLASLVTLNTNGLVASHLPMVLEADGSALGVLRGHVSRANPQWKELDSSRDALAIFSGPQHYISPTWYPSKHEDGKEVPTWNYAVVHAYGPLRVVMDAAWLLAHVERLTDTNEAAREAPWKVSDAPADFVRQMLQGIVGFEMAIQRMEGRWKLSQNQEDRNRRGVIEGLESLGTAESVVMSKMVAERAGFAKAEESSTSSR